jgi:hypothetical protein
MGVKLGPLHEGSNTDWGTFRTGCEVEAQLEGGKNLHNLYSSQNIIRMINNEMGRATSTHVTEGKLHAKFFSKPEGKRPVGRSKIRREVKVIDKVVPVLN